MVAGWCVLLPHALRSVYIAEETATSLSQGEARREGDKGTERSHLRGVELGILHHPIIPPNVNSQALVSVSLTHPAGATSTTSSSSPRCLTAFHRTSTQNGWVSRHSANRRRVSRCLDGQMSEGFVAPPHLFFSFIAKSGA